MARRPSPSRLLPLLAVALVGAVAVAADDGAGSATAGAAPIAWLPWSDDVFAIAERDHRLVLLDLEAVWCHWCHVMDQVTYRDPAVMAVIGERYLAVRVDQDARPDLATRYQDYGWPATIVFDERGRELAKRSGYLPPRPMASMLRAFADDPTPGPSATPEAATTSAGSGALDDALRARLVAVLDEGWDEAHAGWGTVHKYVDADAVEWCLRLALRGGDDRRDAIAAERARRTLDAGLALIDPVWGGVYQYSVGGGWDEPHVEKIMAMQADALRLYADAWAAWRDPRHLAAARAIRGYLSAFLTAPDGAFYVSQDADLVPGEHSDGYFALDDAARRARGVPRVDTHVYARENGWAIAALAEFAAMTGERAALDDAQRATAWIEANRSLPDGGFRHDAADAAGPYLGDALAMAGAYLALRQATLDDAWLAKARATLGWIDRALRTDSGYLTAVPRGPLAPAPDRDENLRLARIALQVGRQLDDAALLAIADRALRFATAPERAAQRPVAGELLADLERGESALRVAVVGEPDAADTAALVAAALAWPVADKRVEIVAPRAGVARLGDLEFPASPTAAAFICGGGRCSAPASDAATLVQRLRR